MTIEQFISLFPSQPFVLRRVERGHGSDRGFVWHAEFTRDYFTSDTDRLAQASVGEVLSSVFGATVEEALGRLADVIECRLGNAVDTSIAECDKNVALLADFRKRRAELVS